MTKTTNAQVDLARAPAAETALAPRARLRTSVRAGGLLDEGLPRHEGPARGVDGEPLPPWWV